MYSFFSALANLVDLALNLYTWAIIARVAISWINPGLRNQFVYWLDRITEPPLYQIRRVLPTAGGLDFSPIVLIFGVMFVRGILVDMLYGLARSFS